MEENRKKAAFHTLGCKVNFYETELMKESFERAGYDIVSEDEKADVYVINTCTVTALADRKSRQFVRRAKRKNPSSLVAAVGCYAQIRPEELSGLEEVDIVLGTEGKSRLPEIVNEYFEKLRTEKYVSVRRHGASDGAEYDESTAIRGMTERTRAYIKIEDGCDRYCAYCVIPLARGRVRSRSPESVLEEAKSLVERGYKEIVLTGVNTALYGKERGEFGLPALLEKLNALEGDFRIRLSSLEPTVVSADEVRELLRFDRLCRHLHLSAQSGSDDILRQMKRPYDRKTYLDMVSALREFDPDYGVSTDIIAGFPGESRKNFEDSLSLVEEAGFVRTHAFKYSRRPHTEAAEMPKQIDDAEKNRRVNELIEAGKRAGERFVKAQKGKRAKVLVEEYSDELGLCSGYGDNYIRFYFSGGRELIGRFVELETGDAYRDGALGRAL